MSALTVEGVVRALHVVSLLPNAPEMTQEIYEGLAMLWGSEGLTEREVQMAALEILKTEKFWPAPSVVIETVKALRVKAGKAAAKAEHDARLREAEMRRLAPPKHEAERFYDVPAGYPPKVGPDPDPNRPYRNGPVLLEDGTPDPFWPELPERSAAWRRQSMYDHGLVSWGYASALTEAEARKFKLSSTSRAVADLA